ncbi:hypothetical protein F8M41_005051 [Gigaspora margarita]|uniref:Uncharacterized protein n=1 Tax=Gigaspora margarita TaxID=4874 RepID=A0A8H4A670_GIGMA|nr:hypothetical protein F8M41_005051 [Gigaspora margarita]
MKADKLLKRTVTTSTVGDIPTTLTHGDNTVLNSYTTVSTSTSGKPATNMSSHNISETLAHDATAIKRTSTEDICMAMSNIRTSSEDISLNDEDFDPMWIQLVEYELREDFQNRKIEYQKQKILGLENNVKSLTNQHHKILEEISKLKES